MKQEIFNTNVDRGIEIEAMKIWNKEDKNGVSEHMLDLMKLKYKKQGIILTTDEAYNKIINGAFFKKN